VTTYNPILAGDLFGPPATVVLNKEMQLRTSEKQTGWSAGARTPARILGVLVVVVAASWLQATGAWAASTGTAEIVRPSDGTPLNSGGSATPFALEVPSGAHCAGDSTVTPFYRLYSYLVPKGTSPVAVNFKTGDPDRWYGLYSDESYYGAVNVEKGSALIAPVIPGNLTFSELTASQLIPRGAASATWEAGVACTTYRGNITAYWNVEVLITSKASDPAGFAWTVTHRVSSSGSTLGFDVAGLGLAVVLGLGAIALVRHRGAPTARP